MYIQAQIATKMNLAKCSKSSLVQTRVADMALSNVYHLLWKHLLNCHITGFCAVSIVKANEHVGGIFGIESITSLIKYVCLYNTDPHKPISQPTI